MIKSYPIYRIAVSFSFAQQMTNKKHTGLKRNYSKPTFQATELSIFVGSAACFVFRFLALFNVLTF